MKGKVLKKKVVRVVIVWTMICVMLFENSGYVDMSTVMAKESSSGSEKSDSEDSEDADDSESKTTETSKNSKASQISQLQTSIKEKESQLGSLKKEKQNLISGKTNIQNVVNDLKSSKKQLNSYVSELDTKLQGIQDNINNYNSMIETKKSEIEISKAELESAIGVVDDQYAAMKKRIQFMYESGDAMYLDLLITANSFGDMLNKADYIEQLSEYDRNQLEEYRLNAQYAQSCKTELEEEQSVLEELEKAAEEEKNNVNTLIEEKKDEINAVEYDINNKEQAIKEYDEELRAQTAEIEALEAAVAAEKSALANASARSYDGGMFTWPAPSYTRISSPFGYRMHPILKTQLYHNGVDLAAPGGSSILAAYSGTVCAAGYSATMGNYIMIDHGSSLYTIYMHASALNVSKGQEVTAGQKIGAVGSTGRSTGNHLHFGVRKDGAYVNPMNYL